MIVIIEFDKYTQLYQDNPQKIHSCINYCSLVVRFKHLKQLRKELEDQYIEVCYTGGHFLCDIFIHSTTK